MPTAWEWTPPRVPWEVEVWFPIDHPKVDESHISKVKIGKIDTKGWEFILIQLYYCRFKENMMFRICFLPQADKTFCDWSYWLAEILKIGSIFERIVIGFYLPWCKDPGVHWRCCFFWSARYSVSHLVEVAAMVPMLEMKRMKVRRAATRENSRCESTFGHLGFYRTRIWPHWHCLRWCLPKKWHKFDKKVASSLFTNRFQQFG